jgi:hypothetical protein
MSIRSSRVALLAWSNPQCVTRTRAHARDLTLTDLRALGLVKRGGSMRPGELARALQLAPAGRRASGRHLVAQRRRIGFTSERADVVGHESHQ